MPEGVIDRLFATYMLRNQVPHWARHYARSIIALDEAGMLDDQDPAYHRYDPVDPRLSQGGVRRFSVAMAAVLICVFGGLWFSHQITGNGTSYLPPYFEERELSPIP